MPKTLNNKPLEAEAESVPSSLRIVCDDATTITLGFSQESETWILPVETVSQDGDTQHASYQSTSVVPRFPINLDPGAHISLKISVKFEKL